ncbi:MAG TPA: hypothetical protein VGB89_17045 [Bacteroidota bacterium]|jgi:RNA polymerase-binding transcription factor DksA
MKRSNRATRKMILLKIYNHLQDHYGINVERDEFINDRLHTHQLDAILAFKSDLVLDSLRGAIDRIEEKTFGLCVLCKGEIAQDAIEENPVRRFCERCEHRYSGSHHHVEEAHHSPTL